MALCYVEGAMRKYTKIFKCLIVGSICLIPLKELSAETASSLIQKTRTLAKDPSSSGRVRFTDSQILDFLNEGQRDTIGATFCIRKNYSFDTSSGSIFYNLPSDYIKVYRLLSNNSRLEESTVLKLDQQFLNWENSTGTPTNYYVSLASRTMIGFYPYPNNNTSTTTIKLEYFAQSVDMASSDTPFNAIVEFIPFHSMLAYYASAQMFYIDGLITSADRYMARYMAYRSDFGEYCKNVNISNIRAVK